MHILQVTKYFYPALSFGGPVQSTYNLSKYLVNRGHKVTVYATDALEIGTNARIKKTHNWIDGIEVFYFRNISKCYGFFISPTLIPALKKNIEEFDLVHLHEYRTFQNFAFHFLNKKRAPYILSCHGEFSYKKQSWDQFFLRRCFERSFGRKIVTNASKLMALTEFERGQYIEGGVKQSKIAIIPNGVARGEFADTSQIQSLKELCGTEQEKVVLYLGRIHKEKGIDILVKAFALLLKGRNDVKLVLAGPDDNFLHILKGSIEKLRITNRVQFLGSLNRQQVLAAYNMANVVVYASMQEGFPMVPLEAGIVGKPVIVSDIPAMNYVRTGKFGLTVKYGNVLQLKEAMDMILSDQELSRALGENGKKFVTENYSWDVIGKKIEDLYRTILN